MSSLSFDQVAHIYDATRGYPDAVIPQIAQSIERTANASEQTHFIEIGVGTGRIAFPLASRGHTYTGVDISEKMIAVLQDKLQSAHWQEQTLPWGSMPEEKGDASVSVQRYIHSQPPASFRLVMSDITALPFQNASFDVVVAVHIFHLVDGWQRAVEEALRVLRSGGMLLHCWDEHGKLDIQDIIDEWQRILTTYGAQSRRAGAASVYFVTDWLDSQGYQTQKIQAVGWERSITPRQILDSITQRIWSNTWSVPDEVFVPATKKLAEWTNNRYRTSMDTPRAQEGRFVINKTIK